VAAYRDTFRLLLTFAQEHTGIPPARLSLEDLNAGLISAYLDHLESQRGVSIKTRNCRLAALHSLFRFAALRHPEHAALIQRVLAIPTKRARRPLISYLTTQEIDALLATPGACSTHRIRGPCPHSADGRPHTWQSGDSADLISFGNPDHGVSVYLGRCRHCAVPLLALAPLSEDRRGDGPVLEVHGAER
jgi:hypothetical protein